MRTGASVYLLVLRPLRQLSSWMAPLDMRPCCRIPRVSVRDTVCHGGTTLNRTWVALDNFIPSTWRSTSLLRSHSGEAGRFVLDPALHIDFGGRQSPRKPKLPCNAVNTMSRVDVLDQDDLVACRSSLARSNRGVCQEEFPDLVVCELDGLSTTGWWGFGGYSRGTISCRTWPRPSRGSPSSSCTNARWWQSSARQWCRRT